MKTFRLSIIFILFLNISVGAQNLIGFHQKEILQIMKDKFKNMSYQNFTNNSTFKYLKYADKTESETWLFFLTPDSICKSVRQVCDKNLKATKIKECDTLYKRDGDNIWKETRNGKNYKIEIREEEATFSVTITLNE
jgi:hypothetical protein